MGELLALIPVLPHARILSIAAVEKYKQVTQCCAIEVANASPACSYVEPVIFEYHIILRCGLAPACFTFRLLQQGLYTLRIL